MYNCRKSKKVDKSQKIVEEDEAFHSNNYDTSTDNIPLKEIKGHSHKNSDSSSIKSYADLTGLEQKNFDGSFSSDIPSVESISPQEQFFRNQRGVVNHGFSPRATPQLDNKALQTIIDEIDGNLSSPFDRTSSFRDHSRLMTEGPRKERKKLSEDSASQRTK